MVTGALRDLVLAFKILFLQVESLTFDFILLLDADLLSLALGCITFDLVILPANVAAVAVFDSADFFTLFSLLDAVGVLIVVTDAAAAAVVAAFESNSPFI